MRTAAIQASADPEAVAAQAKFTQDAMADLRAALGEGDQGSAEDAGTEALQEALTPKRKAKPSPAPRADETNQSVDDEDEVAAGEPSAEATADESADDDEVSHETDADAAAENEDDEQDVEATDDGTAEAEDGVAEEDGRKWPKSFLKRINKLNARLAEAQEKAGEVDALRSEIAELRERAKAGTDNVPAVPVTSAEEALTKEIETLERNLEAIDANPDGMDVGDKSYTAEELRRFKRKFEEQLMDKKLDLREVTRERKSNAQRIETTLKQWHPDLAEAKSVKRTAVERLLESHPILKADPFFKLLTADAVAYRLAQAKANGTNGAKGDTKTVTNGNGSGAGKPVVKPAPRPPGKPTVQPLGVSRTRATAASVQKRFMETGDEKAGLELVNDLLGGGN